MTRESDDTQKNKVVDLAKIVLNQGRSSLNEVAQLSMKHSKSIWQENVQFFSQLGALRSNSIQSLKAEIAKSKEEPEEAEASS